MHKILNLVANPSTLELEHADFWLFLLDEWLKSTMKVSLDALTSVFQYWFHTCAVTFTVCLQGWLSKQPSGMAWDKQKHLINPLWTLCAVGRLCMQRHRESWRSHAFHAGTHRHIYHCAKGQRLMVISHPSPASGAMTLSCWLSLALLTTKLPLSPTLPQSPQHSVPPSPFEKPWLNKAEECGGGGGGGKKKKKS